MIKFGFKKFRIFFIALTIFSIMAIPTSVSAALFYRTGTILRTLSDSTNFGGCMIVISSAIANGCPNNGWVSFDCSGTYSSVENGKRAYASALVAFSLGKKVTVQVDNTKKLNGFCVANRIDIRNF